MARPDLDTLACVNAAWLLFRQTGQSNLVIRLALVRDAKGRLRHNPLPAIFTDAFASYESALLEVFVGLYNFCRAHRSLRSQEADRVIHRRPALAAGLTDHIWTMREWLLEPTLGGRDHRRALSKTAWQFFLVPPTTWDPLGNNEW